MGVERVHVLGAVAACAHYAAWCRISRSLLPATGKAGVCFWGVGVGGMSTFLEL